MNYRNIMIVNVVQNDVKIAKLTYLMDQYSCCQGQGFKFLYDTNKYVH